MYRDSKVLFHGDRIDVISAEFDHPKGGVMRREIVDHPGAVCILAMLDKETVILIRNRREVIGKTLWELPAGTLERGEALEQCAKRELIEETGYEAHQITFLLDFYTTPGFCNEILYSFLAEDLTYVGQNLDETEEIEVFQVPFKRSLEMIKNREIVDVKTIATLLYKAQLSQ